MPRVSQATLTVNGLAVPVYQTSARVVAALFSANSTAAANITGIETRYYNPTVYP